MQIPEKVDPQILLKHARQWVAFTPDRTQIVASGHTPQEVESKLKEQQIADAILHYIPAPDRALSPLCRR